MNIVIVGSGRVGAALAETFDRAGHRVVILDISTRAFDRLPGSFGGEAIRGDGTDEDVLRRAGAEDADLFMSLTEGDNRNIMAAQLAVEAFGARKVIAKINDPVRATAYAELGIATLCRTGLMIDAIFTYLGMPASGHARMRAPSGHQPGGEHHRHEPGETVGVGLPTGQPADPSQASAPGGLTQEA